MVFVQKYIKIINYQNEGLPLEIKKLYLCTDIGTSFINYSNAISKDANGSDRIGACVPDR